MPAGSEAQHAQPHGLSARLARIEGRSVAALFARVQRRY